MAKMILLTGKELKTAQDNHLKVHCEEHFYSPWMNNKESDVYPEDIFCHLESRTILPQDFHDGEVAEIEFEDGYFCIYAVEGVNYK